jgi:RNA polymerase sigma-70 factor (ECF subfamily)
MNDDWQMLELALGGDESAWRDLFRRHFGPLVRMTACVTGSIDAARDVAQESFVRLLRVEIRHREGTVGSLLGTIAYRLALKERKRRGAQLGLGSTDLPDRDPTPLENVIREESDRLIVQALMSLSPEHRETLALRFFSEQSYEEIAELTHVPVGTVKSRIFHATKLCRIRLKELGVFT